MRFWAFLSLLLLGTSAAWTQPVFRLPIACTPGEDCWVQNYPDAVTGSGRGDAFCGRLSYDGHKGTDFRLSNQADMARDVAVLAAADGVVRGVRNDMADGIFLSEGPAAVKDRECGNGVVLVHPDGWESQYCHMRRGSVTLSPGENVRAGAVLGFVGLSGQTEFLHLHFEIRQNGQTVDPFTGAAIEQGCSAQGLPEALWHDSAKTALPYRPTAILQMGFGKARVAWDDAKTGRLDDFMPTAGDGALVLWAEVKGVLEGDRQRFELVAPDGTVFHRRESAIENSRVIWFGFSGARRPDGGWMSGTWTGTYTLVRGGKVVAAQSQNFMR